MNYFVNHYGENKQLLQLSKECIELAHAINDYLDNKDTIDHIKEEMGDVSNLIEQFEEHFNDGVIFSWRIKKQDRQKERIKNEKNI